MIRKLLLAGSIVLATAYSSNAQRYFGVATSNWSGTNALYLNPALMGDSRVKWSIDLFSLNMGIDNSFASLQTNDLFKRLTNADEFKVNDFLKYNNADKFNMSIPGGEVRGPGFYLNVKNKHSFALTTRARVFNQFRNVNTNVFRSIADDNFTDVNGNIELQDNDFAWNANVWSEIGLSYATTLLDKGKHVVRGGVTLRYLGGAGYLGLQGDNLNANYFSDNDSVHVQNTRFNMASNLSNDGAISDLATGSGFMDGLLGKGGLGLGADIGFTYEYRPKHQQYTYEMDCDKNRPDPEKDAYLFRFSAAVTDIGAMRYKKNNKNASFSGNGYFKPEEVGEEIDNINSAETYFRNRGFVVADNTDPTTVKLPTALVLGMDYHIYKGFYANATYIGNLNTKNNQYGSMSYSQLTVTPRYDIRQVTVGVPLTYNFTSESFKAGLGIRVAGFTIGSDDMLAILGAKNVKGANFYLGASIPFNKRRLKDKDGDKVSNKLDKCPEVLGQCEFGGCPPPDRDGDGVLDSLDKCPDVKGIAAANGCPDRDNDGIEDGEDLCPDQPGNRSTMGCPDRDGDNVADKDDLCPDVPGDAKYSGCPDTDGDGVPDNEDLCPEKSGPVAQKGCPDTDADGIADHEDKCPTVPGTRANNGCPEVKEEVKKRLAFAATAIQFETGKAVIKKTSFKMLDEIVNILNEYTDYNMTIDGHTDNTGKAERNLELSKQRAAAVKEYFVQKGISDARLSADGHGDTMPKGNNKTAKGRAENRRVEMDLKLK